MLCHDVLNMQETKYGEEPTKDILTRDLRHSFESMCIFYESLIAMVCFFIYAIIHILLDKCRFTHYTLFLCLYMEHE